jgi:tetratricopeptide (TPR) repeat protein
MSDQEQKTQAPAATQPIPATATGPVEHAELEKFKNFIDKQGTQLLVVLAVVAVAVLAVLWYRRHQETRRAEASAMLFTVNSVQDLDNLISRYDGAPAVPLAMLKQAKSYYDTGSYEMAIKRYDELKQKHPQHPLALAADVGRIHCTEAMGQTEQALDGFVKIIETNPKHFLTPQAIFGRARCLETLNRLQEAKVVYEDFIAANPEGPWVPRAEEQLTGVKRKLGLPTEKAPVRPQAKEAAPSGG